MGGEKKRLKKMKDYFLFAKFYYLYEIQVPV